MKQLSLLILLTSCFWANAQLQNDPSTIAYYPFDGNGNDLSSNAFNATIVGSASFTSDHAGVANSAFSLTGSNYLIVNNVTSAFKPTQLPVSVSLWMKIPSNFQGQVTFFKNDFAENIYSGIRGTVIPNGTVTIGLENGGPIGTGSRKTKTGTTNIKDGQWHLITCIVRSFSNMDIYVDCHNDGGSYSGGASTLSYSQQNPGIIGAYDGVLGAGGFEYGQGAIDELLFIGRELTVSEIQSRFFNETASVNGPSSLCPGTSGVITAVGGTAYLWDNGSTNPMRTITSPGTYSVTIFHGEFCTSEKSITVNASQVSPLTVTPLGSTSFCEGGSVQLSVNADGNFIWNDGNTQNPRTVNASGDYYVSSVSGCATSSNTVNVDVHSNPAQPTITPNGPLSFYVGGSVTLQSSLASAYEWIPTGGNASSIQVSQSGSFSVKVFNDYQCSAISESVTITVLPIVEPPNNSCSAVEVISYNPLKRNDGSFLPASRTISSNALGAAQNSDSPTSEDVFNAVSLGFGGELTVRMSGKIANGEGNDLKVFETTFTPDAGNCIRYPERIQVFASQDNCNWVYLGSGCQDAEFDLGELDWAEYIRLIDISPIDGVYNNQVADGYDVDAIECLNGYKDSPVLQDLGANYATQVVNTNQQLRKNGTPVTLARSDASKVLGAPQNSNTVNFYALGFGGSITLKLGYVVFNKDGNDLQVVETSYGNPACSGYPEKANVEVSLDGSAWFDLGQICLDGGVDFSTQGINAVQFVRITDHSALSSFNASADGYDVDGIVVLQPGCGNSNNSARIEDDIWTKDETALVFVTQTITKDFTSLQVISANEDETLSIQLVSMTGQKVKSSTLNVNANSSAQQLIDLSDLSSGVYLLSIQGKSGIESFKIIKQ